MLKRSIVLCTLLAGCTSAPKVDPNYIAYLQTMQAVQTVEQRPLVELKALPGQSIAGLASFTVYAPQSGNQAASVAVPQAQVDPWAGVAHTAISAAAQVAGGVVLGSAVKAGFSAIERAGTAGYQHIQAAPVVVPQANVTTTNATMTTASTTANSTTVTNGSGVQTLGGSSTIAPVSTSTANSNNPATSTSTSTSTNNTTNSNNPLTTTSTNTSTTSNPITGK